MQGAAEERAGDADGASGGSLLIAEDEAGLARATARLLNRAGWRVDVVHDGAAAIERVRARRYDAVLLDLMMPNADGFDVLSMLRAQSRPPPVILLSGYLDVETTVRGLRAGAHAILEKPVDAEHLVRVVGEAVESATPQPAAQAGEWVGRSPAAQRVRDAIERAGSYPEVPVLIVGETGTGKELVARALHRRSGSSAPMVALNCAAIPGELFESELFGHEAGAFTGAQGARRGLLEEAGDGVLFLDEVGEMPRAQQAKLLRVLETRSFRRVGSSRSLALRARVVSATNRALSGREGEALRADLYFRLAGFTVHTPALRDRLEDLGDLCHHLLRDLRSSYPSLPTGFSPEAIDALATHDWPGNARELRALIQTAALRSIGELVRVHSVVEALRERGCFADEDPKRRSGVHRKVRSEGLRREASEQSMNLCEMEREAILGALEECGGNLSRTARQLGMPRSTLRDKLRRYGER